MLNWIAVFVGGALGSGMRYGISLVLLEKAPLGTFIANVLGSFLLALLTAWSLSSSAPHPATRLLLTTGLCGGFTTYSTFNLETLRMLQGEHFQRGAFYLFATLATCLLAAAAGLILGKIAFPKLS
ncbi:MAG: fluoride efflux transporter CrcB [Deltaproteobacteria bacterium]|nr:fluoride efflux transporter CrcB [Deltaproteobacteria bacterium]